MSTSPLRTHGPAWRLAAALSLFPLAAGCGDLDGFTDRANIRAIPGDDGILDLEPRWNAIEPGGDTVCARGAPFRFFVRPGTVNKLVVEFRGGGACWNEQTCAPGASVFQEEVGDDPFLTDESKAGGIHVHTRADNPFATWHHVYIPYCTGDIHWGNSETTYGEGRDAFTVHHKGAVNARAALDWIFDNVQAPDQVLVTGCSAGAYGSILWSPHIRRHYDRAQVLQLADSGTGVVTEAFLRQSLPAWKPESAFPDWIEGLDLGSTSRLPQLYQAIGAEYPDMILSQYTTKYDSDQTRFYILMGGGNACEWSEQMMAHLREITDTTPNFTSFVAPGHVHCILGRDDFYTLETSGTKLVDWLNEMVQGRVPPSALCPTGSCGAPE